SDELVAVVVVIASGWFIAMTAWLWSRRGRWRGIVAPTIYTVAIAAATTIICLLIEANLRGDRDLLFFGFVMVGAAAIILVWVVRLYRLSRGRPVKNVSDGLANLHC